MSAFGVKTINKALKSFWASAADGTLTPKVLSIFALLKVVLLFAVNVLTPLLSDKV